ncbi:MAG TPA: 6-bladed beta-propeller [Balneolaceae bacterium]|nr:6-bladed beta-propeller [Balneolaceae bacterium]
MRLSRNSILLICVLLIIVTGCNNKNGGSGGASGIKADILKKHHTLKSNKKLLLGLPVKLKYDDITDHLFILDANQRKIIEIGDSSNIVNEFGGEGKGPGESIRVDNFFITQKYLYTLDETQRLINKFSLQDGHYISSLNYGQLLLKKKNYSKSKTPPPPRFPYYDNNNQPFVTNYGTILLPTQTGGKHLYEAVNWKGKKLADIGAIPKGYKAEKNKNKYWATLENRNVPASDLDEAFPVNDCQDRGDIYLIYPAVPKIAKYSLSGQKIWEHKIPPTPEVDSIMINLSDFAKLIKNHPQNNVALIPVRIYIAGRCSSDGDLYLTTYTHPTPKPSKFNRPLWIQQFSPKGKLIKRYKTGTNIEESPFSAFNFKKHRIFVSSYYSAQVRVYHF